MSQHINKHKNTNKQTNVYQIKISMMYDVQKEASTDQ